MPEISMDLQADRDFSRMISVEFHSKASDWDVAKWGTQVELSMDEDFSNATRQLWSSVIKFDLGDAPKTATIYARVEYNGHFFTTSSSISNDRSFSLSANSSSKTRFITPNIDLAGVSPSSIEKEFILYLSHRDDLESATHVDVRSPVYEFPNEGEQTIFAWLVNRKTRLTFKASVKIDITVPTIKEVRLLGAVLALKEDKSVVPIMGNFDEKDLQFLRCRTTDLVANTDMILAELEGGGVYKFTHSTGTLYPSNDVEGPLKKTPLSIEANENAFSVQIGPDEIHHKVV